MVTSDDASEVFSAFDEVYEKFGDTVIPDFL